MTTVYFMKNTANNMGLWKQFFEGKEIDVLFSAPEGEVVRSIRPFAMEQKVPAYVLDELQEAALTENETLHDVQERMIDALQMMVNDYQDKVILVCTHPVPIGSVVEYFDSTFGYEDYQQAIKKQTYVMKMEFEGESCLGIEEILCV
ncbi:phosphoglycerate mutase family 2 [Lachnospiraceae bacterium KM106-2]|nr:phosphoglycerate mutase family 2 [Lachnospiraceae bacterium KM106-2]